MRWANLYLLVKTIPITAAVRFLTKICSTVHKKDAKRRVGYHMGLLPHQYTKPELTGTAQEHADAAMSLLCSKSTGIDFRSRKLVGVGQCGGSTSLHVIQLVSSFACSPAVLQGSSTENEAIFPIPWCHFLGSINIRLAQPHD